AICGFWPKKSRLDSRLGAYVARRPALTDVRTVVYPSFVSQGDTIPVSPSREQAPEPPRQSRKGMWGTLATFGLFILAKLKGVLLLLKALPAAKLLLTTGSM